MAIHFSSEHLREHRQDLDTKLRRHIRCLQSSQDSSERTAAVEEIARMFSQRNIVALLDGDLISLALDLTHGEDNFVLRGALETLIRAHADNQGVVTMRNGVRITLANVLGGKPTSPIRQDTHGGKPFGPWFFASQENGNATRLNSIVTLVQNLPE